jgi:hypothetical protein
MFLPTDAVRWFTEEVDISTVESVDDLKQDLIDMREDVRGRAEDRPAVLRLRLVGRGDLHTKIRLWDTEHEIAVPLRDGEAGRRDFVWVDSVQTATRSPIDIPQRREFTDFIGDFLRSAEDLRTQPNALETLREMLTKKREHRIISSLIADFSEADLRSILDEAEALGLDHLLEEENSNANLRSTH